MPLQIIRNDTISTFLMGNEMMVYIVIFDKKAYQISGKLFALSNTYEREHRRRLRLFAIWIL